MFGLNQPTSSTPMFFPDHLRKLNSWNRMLKDVYFLTVSNQGTNMDDATIYQLVMDTLSGRRMEGGRSIKHNAAGIQLTQCTVEALPIIERVIEDISQQLSPMRTNDDLSGLGDDLIGLPYVLGAHLLISVRNHVDSVFEFIHRQHCTIVLNYVAACAVFFRRMDDGQYNFGVAPNDAMKAFLTECTFSKDLEIAKCAQRTLAMYPIT